jgi:deoxyguanosine kinase
VGMKTRTRAVYVGFGANVGNPLDTYARAKVILESKLGPVWKESAVYESGALTLDGSESQNNYYNSVIAFQTEFSAREVLAVLLETELLFKRDRSEAKRWAPRPIDLDILFAGDEVIEEEGLTVPHPELHKRDFVLCPLRDITPDFMHPTLEQTVETLESSLEARGYRRLIVRRFELGGCAGSDSDASRCAP